MPEPDAPRKPPKRFWLYAPYVLLAVAAVGWSGWWVYGRGRIAAGLDAAAASAQAAGGELSWRTRRIGGYPFRFDVTLEGARAAEASGWSLAAPELKAETYAYRPDRWIAVAPRGVVLTRPGKGAAAIAGEALRASISDLAASPPRVAVEGVNLTFTPQAGGAPLPIAAARRIELYMRPQAGDQAGVLFKLEGGKAADGPLARIAGDKPVSAALEGQFERFGALRGGGWAQAARNWAGAGGAFTLIQGGLTAGDASLSMRRATLTVGGDGRLRGVVPTDLHKAAGALLALGQGQTIDPAAAAAAAAVAQARQGADLNASVNLTFEAGRTTLGPVAVGDAPRLF
ncbi:MAG: DUF2125 domain-containing protein [Caulobacteraceae bacterium]|nr:DUF2125 domain-containing protein [Caulobacteraceae bacterium]